MTVQDIINKSDELFPNVISFTTKALWLKELDGRIYSEFLSRYPEGTSPQGEYTPLTELLVPDEFHEIYIRYLTMQQDILNGDMVRYQNSASLFNSSYLAFMNYYNRNHLISGSSINFEQE